MSLKHPWLVLLLVCAMAAGSVVEVAHLHKDAPNARHACMVCAAHAPALASSPAVVVPAKSVARGFRAAPVVRYIAIATRTFFIRPPPSV